jgi:hypothetical protein
LIFIKNYFDMFAGADHRRKLGSISASTLAPGQSGPLDGPRHGLSSASSFGAQRHQFQLLGQENLPKAWCSTQGASTLVPWTFE